VIRQNIVVCGDGGAEAVVDVGHGISSGIEREKPTLVRNTTTQTNLGDSST